MCVAFIYLFLWRRSRVFFLSSCWVWGRLLLSLFWCDCSAFFPGASAVFRCVSCSWLPFSGSTPCCLRLADLLPSGFCTFGGCCNLSGSSLLVYSCGGALWLGWRGLCCVTWFSPMCRALPQGLQVTLGFSGHRVSVLLLPW